MPPPKKERDPIADALEMMVYGLYIVGSRKGDEVNGMMADWVMQVSFRPRLVLVALERDARTLENVRASGAFTVNMLGTEEADIELARRFAQPYYAAKVEGRPEEEAAKVYRKLEGIPYSRSRSGCPVLDQAVAWLECQVEQEVEAGDHVLVIGRVVDGDVRRYGPILSSEVTGWTYSG
jgi:flavin reductase (DIM6/NTAB) family NADH-FMN oxidoreductase RutF